MTLTVNVDQNASFWLVTVLTSQKNFKYKCTPGLPELNYPQNMRKGEIKKMWNGLNDKNNAT